MKNLLVIFILFISTNLMANSDDDLLNAAKELNFAKIKKAISNKANINAKDNKGKTALIIVCSEETPYYQFRQKIMIIEYLIKAGIDVNAEDNEGKTALITLFSNNKYSYDFDDYQLRIMKLLISKNADLTHIDTNKKSANNYLTDTLKDNARLIDYKNLYQNDHYLIDKNIEPSYIGICPLNLDKWSSDKCNQIIEGDITPQMNFFTYSPKENYNFFIYFTPKIILRMYMEDSAPVKTPSFMPRLTWYMWWNKFNDKCKNYFDFFYLYLTVSHHSNGQNGDFYTDDGKVNTNSGNFSTNFAELAANLITWSNDLTFVLGYRQHCTTINREKKLNDQYESGCAFTKFKFFGFHDNVRFFTSASYITTGRKYIQRSEDANDKHPEIDGMRAKFHDNMNYQVEFQFSPWCKYDFNLPNLFIFIKYDYGYDYYNIHFQEKINKLQFGFSFTTD